MAINTYTGTAASGNPTNVYQVPELLMAADAVEVIKKCGVKLVRVPANKNETVSFLRAVTPDPNVNETPEATTPASRAMVFEQATTTFEEFVEIYEHSSRQAELGEIDILKAEKDRIKDLYRRTKEKNSWYTFRAANNAIYNSNAVTSTSGVNGPISLGRLRLASRFLQNNRAKYLREMTKGSAYQNTTPVEPAYMLLIHTDAKADFRDLPGFVLAPRVGGARDVLPEWFGNIEDFMVIASPEFDPELGAGAAVGSTGMRSVGGSNVDVYTSLAFGVEALGCVELFGAGGGDMGMWQYILDKADKSDPANQRRKIAIRWYDAPLVLNQNWVVPIKHGVTANLT
jgi:N4-gp56 family major capsid protein